MYLYFKPSENWKEAGATFFAHTWGGTNDIQVQFATEVEPGIYKSNKEVSDNFTQFLLVRMAPDSTEINWDNNWGRSADMSHVGNNNLYTMPQGWEPEGGTWSMYSEATDPITVTLVAGTGVTLDAESVETTNRTVSTVLTLAENTSDYQWQIEVKNGETSYDNWEFDNSTKTLTIKNLTENITLTISTNGEILLDGNYIEVNNEYRPEYKLGPHEGYEEKIEGLELKVDDHIGLVQIIKGHVYEVPVNGAKSGTNDETLTQINETDITILKDCTVNLYVTVSGSLLGKMWVEAKLVEVNITYVLGENVTASNVVETWPFKEPFSTTLSTIEGYEINRSSVKITVGSNHFTAEDSVYDKLTDTITISNVDGHIKIEAEAQEEVIVIPGWYFWYEDKNGNTNKILFSTEKYDYLEEQQYTIPAEVTDYLTTGGEFRFKVLYKHEDKTESWLSVQNSDNWSDLLGSATSNIDPTYGDPTIHMDEAYPRYHLYIQKVEDQLGHYWIEQTYPVSLNLTNSISSNTASKTYRWTDYTTNISFVGKPNTELLTIKVGGELADFDSVCTVIENGYMITITKDELGPIEIVAYSEGEEGTEGCWLMTGDGGAIAEMAINPENTEEYYIEYDLVAGQYYSFDKDGSTIALRDFKTADTTGPSGENEYYSGTGVGTDLDVYLNLISLDESKTKLAVAKNCVAKIYVRATGRIWVSVEEEPLSVTGEDFDKISLTNIKHLYLKNNTYYTYPGVHLEFAVSGKSGYSLQSLRITHNGASNDYTSSGSVNVSIREVLSAVVLTPSLVFNETSKKIKLFDQNSSIILYPKTRTDQVVNLVGDNLETVLNRLVERIVALEQALNNKQ